MARTIFQFRPTGALVTALAALCLTLLSGQAARAGAYTYGNTPQRTVNAGVLLVDGNPTPGAPTTWPTAANPDNKDPYVFYVLSQRNDIVPFGWSIVNPIANSGGTVTSQIKLRWDARTGAAASPTYQLGQSLTPAMAAYWEVPLTQTMSDDLAKFDVLLLNVVNDFRLTAGDYEKLRRFVEGGGTLWIEDSFSPAASGGGIVLNAGYNTNEAATLFGSVQFQGNTAGGAYATVPGFSRSPLITTPYSLSENELNALGTNQIGNYYASNVGSTTVPIFLTALQGIVTNSGSSRPVIASGQYGSGQVVVTCTGSANAVNDYVGGVDVSLVTGSPRPNSGPYCGTAYTLAPTQDLKLVTDILASADGHQNEHQNTRQTGVSLNGLPAVAKSWSDTDFGGGQTGATVYGHMAYVTKGGSLYAYDLYPSEDLDGNGDPDDRSASAPAPDFDNGKPYDIVWTALNIGTNLSAPTVAVVNGAPTVFVELSNGKVVSYNAATGGSGSSYGTAAMSYTSLTPVIPTPAPTVFEGRLYAGRADGTLYVYDLTGTTTTDNVIAVDSTTTDTAQAIVAPPTVGIVTNSRGDNDIVALCTTGNGLYSVFLGSRGELLQRIGSGTGLGLNTKLVSLSRAQMETNINTALVYSAVGSPAGTPTYHPTDKSAIVSGTTHNFAISNTDTTYFSTDNGTDPLYANYYADIKNSYNAAANPGALTRTVVGVLPSSANGAANAVVSTPALDRLGNVYYTVTVATTTGTESVLYSVHDAPNPADVRINWRFLLPQTAAPITSKDADNADYSPLTGYTFTTTAGTGTASITAASAPVVDDNSNVYVLATNGTATAVLCFNGKGDGTGTGSVSADIGDPNAQQGGVNITQPINGTDEFGNALAGSVGAAQYTVGTGGHITFTNFGQESNVGNGTHALYPNLNEPYPITVNYSTNIGNAGNPTTVNGLLVPLHTNLEWYTVLNTVNNQANHVPVAASGLTKAGNDLYFVDGDGCLDSVRADLSSTTKYVDATPVIGATTPPVFTRGPYTGTGATTATPSAGNGVLLVNGPNGTTAFTNQITLVVDSNRVLEMDSNGDAEWAVDATSKTTLAGDTTPIYNINPSTGAVGTGQFVTTTLELNRPSSLTELTPNDYLVADTGNNRCVRFDRAGKVIWELTKFTDSTTNPLLKPGEPDTINQPTSVQIRTETIPVTVYDSMGVGTSVTGTIVRYLISDTGNFRIVEVDDIYDNYHRLLTDVNGKVVGNHTLNWISHTHDVQSREYRYQSASYYVVSYGTGASAVTKYYVAALVTNKRIAIPLPTDSSGNPTGALLAANQDTAGGSIALLDYYPATRPVTDGYITAAISSIKVHLKTTGLPAFIGGFDANATINKTGTPQTLYLRNPRYLKAYVPQGASPTDNKNLLIADDNGVFDLDGSTYPPVARFGFTQVDYRNMTAPLVATTLPTTFPRANIPFIPASIQLLGTDSFGTSPSNYVLGRYLITNSFSQGENANDSTKIGGEVFEVDPNSVGTDFLFPGGYGGHTLSRPSNTSPLSQPAFAYRLQQ